MTEERRYIDVEGAGVCRHVVGDANCAAGWCGASRYPILCKCGGLIHADWGDEDYDENYWVYLACDRCEDAYEEVDSR